MKKGTKLTKEWKKNISKGRRKMLRNKKKESIEPTIKPMVEPLHKQYTLKDKDLVELIEW